MATPSIQTLTTDAQQVLNLESISAVRSVVAAALANANVGTPLNPNLTTQQLWNEFYQIVTQPKSDIESIIANQLMKFLYAPPAPGGVGADKQVIFNDGGVLAGDAGLTYDKTTDALTIGGNINVSGDGAFIGTGRVGLQRPFIPTGQNGTTTLDYRWYSTGTTYVTGARIRASSEAAWSAASTPARLMFETVPSGAAALVERYRISGEGVHTWLNAEGVLATAMTLNATGLGVGVSPSTKLDVLGSGDGEVRIRAGSDAALIFSETAANKNWKLKPSGGNFQFQYSATAYNSGYSVLMTLDASGNLLVGKSSASATTIGFEGRANGTVNSTLASSVDSNATYAAYSTGAAAYRFYVGMGGTVYATNTTISAISDARLKENVQDIDVGLGAILALKPRKFDWKEGKGKNIKGDRGFIAQEFEQVFPQLVDEWKDEAPEGEAPYKSVRQDLIPVLVKAIQELTARVQTLETR